LSSQDVKKSILDYKKKIQCFKEPIGGVFLILASHGSGYDYFKTSDDHIMSLDVNIIDEFNGKNFKEIQDIHKVFLVNICRLITLTIRNQ